MNKYKGMTTLDRLADAGLLQEFEQAVKLGAREAAIKILLKVELTLPQAVAVWDGAVRIKRDVGL